MIFVIFSNISCQISKHIVFLQDLFSCNCRELQQPFQDLTYIFAPNVTLLPFLPSVAVLHLFRCNPSISMTTSFLRKWIIFILIISLLVLFKYFLLKCYIVYVMTFGQGVYFPVLTRRKHLWQEVVDIFFSFSKSNGKSILGLIIIQKTII